MSANSFYRYSFQRLFSHLFPIQCHLPNSSILLYFLQMSSEKSSKRDRNHCSLWDMQVHFICNFYWLNHVFQISKRWNTIGIEHLRARKQLPVIKHLKFEKFNYKPLKSCKLVIEISKTLKHYFGLTAWNRASDAFASTHKVMRLQSRLLKFINHNTFLELSIGENIPRLGWVVSWAYLSSGSKMLSYREIRDWILW